MHWRKCMTREEADYIAERVASVVAEKIATREIDKRVAVEVAYMVRDLRKSMNEEIDYLYGVSYRLKEIISDIEEKLTRLNNALDDIDSKLVREIREDRKQLERLIQQVNELLGRLSVASKLVGDKVYGLLGGLSSQLGDIRRYLLDLRRECRRKEDKG